MFEATKRKNNEPSKTVEQCRKMNAYLYKCTTREGLFLSRSLKSL